MSKKEIAILAFKVLSLYAVINAIAQLPNALYFFNSNTMTEQERLFNTLLIILPPLLLVLFSVFLWYAASKLASIIFKATISEDIIVIDFSLIDVQAIAFSIVGLFIFALALPDFVNLASIYYHISNGSMKPDSQLTITIIVFLIQIIFGLWLLFGSKSIVSFVHSIGKKTDISRESGS